MSVQLLSSDYISKVNPQQLNALVEDGTIIRQGNNYYASINAMSESCFAKKADGTLVDPFNVDQNTGLVLEKTTPASNETVVRRETTTTMTFDDLFSNTGLPEDKKDALKEFLIGRGILSNDQNNSITINNNENASMNRALQEFYNSQRTSTATITDDETRTLAINNGAINNNNEVTDREQLDGMFDTQVSLSDGELIDTETITVPTQVTTVTEKKLNGITVPANMENKEARKAFEHAQEEVVRNNLYNPDFYIQKETIIAQTRYDKQIEKQAHKIESECNGSPNKILQKYLGIELKNQEITFLENDGNNKYYADNATRAAYRSMIE